MDDSLPTTHRETIHENAFFKVKTVSYDVDRDAATDDDGPRFKAIAGPALELENQTKTTSLGRRVAVIPKLADNLGLRTKAFFQRPLHMQYGSVTDANIQEFLDHIHTDFQDLFCTLMVALPLSQHIQFFQKYPHTFTTREALGHLGNLRFTQSNKRPSPDDPNIMVTTKIATTFSMVEPMARTLCGKFRAARFVEQVGGNLNFGSRDDHFQSPSSIWRMTPKGIRLLESFASRNGVQDRHVLNVLQSPRNCMNLLVLERESENDALKSDRGTIEVIFRRFAGQDGPNTLNGSVSSDSDSFDEASMGLAGVKQSVRKLPNQKNVLSVFSGKDCVDWLMSCSTMVDPREAHDVAKWFIDYGLVQSVYAEKDTPNMKFNEGKNAFYAITPDGQRVAKWVSGRPGATAETMNASPAQMKDSSATRMFNILQSASLRIMFREFLEEAHCLENLDFYQEVRDFLGRWKPVLEKHKAKGTQPAHETLSEILALAYDIYNSYLAPGAPRELNIDHNLRTSVVTRMTRIELPQMEMPKTIDEIMYLYDTVQGSIFKLMASDSVPKFMRDPKYRPLIAEAAANNQIITGFSPAMVPPATRNVEAISS